MGFRRCCHNIKNNKIINKIKKKKKSFTLASNKDRHAVIFRMRIIIIIITGEESGKQKFVHLGA